MEARQKTSGGKTENKLNGWAQAGCIVGAIAAGIFFTPVAGFVVLLEASHYLRNIQKKQRERQGESAGATDEKVQKARGHLRSHSTQSSSKSSEDSDTEHSLKEKTKEKKEGKSGKSNRLSLSSSSSSELSGSEKEKEDIKEDIPEREEFMEDENLQLPIFNNDNFPDLFCIFLPEQVESEELENSYARLVAKFKDQKEKHILQIIQAQNNSIPEEFLDFLAQALKKEDTTNIERCLKVMTPELLTLFFKRHGDVLLEFQDEQTVLVNKALLSFSSDYFAGLFRFLEEKEERDKVAIQDFTSQEFKYVLNSFYFKFNNINTHNLLPLTEIADKCGFDNLLHTCQRWLERPPITWENVESILALTEQDFIENREFLIKRCENWMIKQLDDVENIDDFNLVFELCQKYSLINLSEKAFNRLIAFRDMNNKRKEGNKKFLANEKLNDLFSKFGPFLNSLSLNVDHLADNSEVLFILEYLPNIKHLTLLNAKLNKELLNYLKTKEQLQSLEFVWCEVEDKKCLNLFKGFQSLAFDRCYIEIQDLIKLIKKCSNLRNLKLFGFESSKNINYIGHHQGVLSIIKNGELLEKLAKTINKHCTKLETLYLGRSRFPLKELSKLIQLRDISLHEAVVNINQFSAHHLASLKSLTPDFSMKVPYLLNF